ncbi:MAG: sigma-70 family RNA polymerase sigma factor [Saprospiraceae bacterium]|jgi:RNA polymerase sigma factor (sigma-70 family)|nr:sigma-70 family RNA polymerase sigma factor [Saprospiraceae bacterium]
MELDDDKLLEYLQSADRSKRNIAFYFFYKNEAINTWLLNYLLTHGGTADDKDDVFQETIIILDRNVRNLSFQRQCSIQTYFISIAKWYWLGLKRKSKNIVEFESEMSMEFIESFESSIILEERKNFINKALSQIDTRCQELLKYYKLDYSMIEISKLLNYSSPEIAKKQAYRCREKLKIIFTQSPQLMDIINL